MSLKTIFTEICEKLEDSKNVSKSFNNFKSEQEKFSATYELCFRYISKLNYQKVSKCSEKSREVRKTGNEYFGKNLHWQALKFYNESIALAPGESEELAVAFGNRASCLLRLDFPKEALEDVETALNFPASNDFKNKLLVRKEKCLNELNNKSITNSCIFGSGKLVPLSRGKSSHFDSASNLVGLLYDEYFERQLIANDDIKTGEVLIVEKPYSSVLLPEHYYTHCANCFTRCFNLIPCNNCTNAMFCNEKCKTSAYNRYHKIECSILNILVKLKAGRMELLSLRILIDASHQGESLEKLFTETTEFDNNKTNKNNICENYKSLDYFNIYNLVTNSNKRAVSDIFYRSVISTILILMLEMHTKFFESCDSKKKHSMILFSGGLILHFLQSLPCNAHEISEFCEDGLSEIGAGAYATLSLINHSCDPNVVRYSCNEVIVLKTIKPIKKGQQILDNYGYHYATHSHEERQKALSKQYYFECQCEACTQNWPTYEDLPGENVITKKEIDMKLYENLTEKFEKTLQKIFTGSFDTETIEENMRYLDFLDECVKRPWKTYNKCQEAIKHCWSFSGNCFRFSKGVFSE